MNYEVHIGKLIRGRRELEGKGIFLRCTTDQRIQEIATFGTQEGIFISRRDVENALYDFCKSALSEGKRPGISVCCRSYTPTPSIPAGKTLGGCYTKRGIW